MVQTKHDIIQEIDQRFDRLFQWLEQQPAERFSQGPEGKWTTGQHISHLIKSTKPLNMALRLPKIQLKAMFGKPNRPLRSYDEVVQRYQEKLAGGGVSTAQFVAEESKATDKSGLIAELDKERGKLTKIIAKWEEEKLDKYLLPHPLLGKMLIREMLFFTIYHTEHHTKSLEDKY
ncbi:MAG: DinB family protein [Bacteroidota bacterium]